MPEKEEIRAIVLESLATVPKPQTTSKVTNWLLGILAALVVSGIGFLANKAVDSNDKLTELKVTVPELREEVKSIKTDVAESVGKLVTRPELESRLAEIKVDSAQIKVEQSHLAVEIIKLQQAPHPQ
jgi:hypothetical protein